MVYQRWSILEAGEQLMQQFHIFFDVRSIPGNTLFVTANPRDTENASGNDKDGCDWKVIEQAVRGYRRL
jgi:hypothetical protein